uniref:hypothetical protein n=1 Tax=Longicatena caecimuris TaxID=1796635 RepID=UPI0022E770AA
IYLMSKGVKLITFLLYTIPLITGLFYEIYLVNQYKKLNISENIIERILKLITVRITNISLFCTVIIILLVDAVLVDTTYSYEYSTYVDSLNKYCILFYIIVLIISIIMFIIGNIIEKNQVIKNKKKSFVPAAITGSLATLGYFIVKNSSYTIIIIFSIILFTITPNAIGKIYFRFKNFNKKIGQADVLIDYKI